MSEHALDRLRAEPASAAPGRPWAAQAWAQYRLERRMFWRNPSAAFFNFLLPLLFLAFFGAIFSGEQGNLDVLLPGIAGMSVMSATFVALAHNMVALRERGVLKRIRGTPLRSSAYFAAIAGNAVTNTFVQVAIIMVAGRVFFGVDWPRDWASLALFVVVGVVCFAALGVALAHVVPNLDSAPAYINAVFLPVIFISGVFYDAERAPAGLRDAAELLPLKHLIDGLSGAWVEGRGVGHHITALIVLLVWAVAGVVLAVRGFSWEARRS
jgi:ABC-2 type transport system permease protein